MKHHVFYEVQTAEVCPYKYLFDEYFEQLSQKESFKSSNIYIFARVKKLRFDLNKTKIINSRTLQTTIIVGNEQEYDLRVSFFDTVPIFKYVFKTKENLEKVLSDDNDIFTCEIDRVNSTSEKLCLYLKPVVYEDEEAEDNLNFILTP